MFFDENFVSLPVEEQWDYIIVHTPDRVRLGLSDIVSRHGETCVVNFYEALLKRPDAALFLERETVERRLRGSLLAWLKRLFPARETDIQELRALQERVGSVHAQLEISPNLVSYGFYFIKMSLTLLIVDYFDTKEEQLQACVYCQSMVDFAMTYMNKAYNTDFRKKVEQDQSFKLFSLGQDLHFEKETQKATFFDWSTQALFCLCEQRVGELQTIGESQFGLWLAHKGQTLFRGTEDFALLRDMIGAIDRRIAAVRAEDGVPAGFAAELRNGIRDVTFLTNRLFQAMEALQSGLDPLTRTLTRHFLDGVIQNEIAFSLTHDKVFSIVLLDIDFFKKINDTRGHLAGDEALRHVAGMIMETVRGNDYVFRYGGEEFLIVLTESASAEAAACAERIRSRIEKSAIPCSTGDTFSLTISAGIATFQGGIKIGTLIEQADRALYAAKDAGRNRIEIFSRDR
ncbi:diguanylate cyclase [Gluconacetobacter tumulicola]|uniref:Diguanylate cyclase DosC n=1 Tax=Gluconacetobacter tumulicola TaxID=1017177 RepID=A0A7W4JGR1_9PROT|nr:GGDEF domain-containing protein [Gluconacetobacter tumulicola]